MWSLKLEKAGLIVLIAVLVGGLASSPVFSSSYSAFAQYDEDRVMIDAELAIEDAEEEIVKAETEIADASDEGKETEIGRAHV